MLFKTYSKRFRMRKMQISSQLEAIMEENFKMNPSRHFFDENGISHNFSCPRRPQHNGIVESKIEHCNKWIKFFWIKSMLKKEMVWTINISCYIMERVSIKKILNKTPYKLWKDIKLNISYFHNFGCYWYILNHKEPLKIWLKVRQWNLHWLLYYLKDI